MNREAMVRNSEIPKQMYLSLQSSSDPKGVISKVHNSGSDSNLFGLEEDMHSSLFKIFKSNISTNHYSRSNGEFLAGKMIKNYSVKRDKYMRAILQTPFASKRLENEEKTKRATGF
jgi:hypothetical protein